jgi:hypothetical protein
VATAYQREVQRVQDRANEVLTKAGKPAIQIDPLDEVFVVPQRALCTQQAYPNATVPAHIKCDADPSAVPLIGRRLYVVGTQWKDGLERGVAEAACVYNQRDGARVEELCRLEDPTPDGAKNHDAPPDTPADKPAKPEPAKKPVKRAK